MSENNGRGLEPIFVLGYPGHLGGACTELWHTVKLWRRFGLGVTLIPTWSAPEPVWLQKTNAIGCVTRRANPNLGKSKDEPRGSADVPLKDIDGLPGAIIVSFCNDQFLPHIDQFRQLNCRIVWVNCMNWLHPMERKLYALFGPFDAYMFQSKHQYRTLGGQLSGFGVTRKHMHHIPGYLDAEEFTFDPRPHAEGEEFVIGRMSRAAPDKFSTTTWPIIERVDYPKKR